MTRRGGETGRAVHFRDNKREKNIKVYLLNKINSSNNEIMLVYNNSNKIENIKIVEISEGLNLLNDFSFFK